MHFFRGAVQDIFRTPQPTADEVIGVIAEYRSHVVDVDSRNLKRLFLLTSATLDVVDEWLAAATPAEQRHQIYQSLRATAQELRQELDWWKE